MLKNIGIEQAFPATFDGLTTAFVLGDVWHNTIVETDLTSSQRIKTCVGIEESALKDKPQTFHRLESGPKMRFEMVSVVMITRDDLGGSHDKTSDICNGQDVGGLS